jgi:hypothetical protein
MRMARVALRGSRRQPPSVPALEDRDLRGRNHSRLQGFSDAVFALAATLLVVTLEVPDSYDALLEAMTGFPAFALAFGAIVSLWNNHRSFFTRYPLGDTWTIAINSVLLFVVLLYVYPLKLFAEVVAGYLVGTRSEIWLSMGEAEIGGLFVIFGAGVLATTVSLLALHTRAYKLRTELGLGSAQLNVLRHDILTYAAVSGIALLSVVVAALGLGIGFGLPGLLYLLAPVVSVALEFRTRRRR